MATVAAVGQAAVGPRRPKVATESALPQTPQQLVSGTYHDVRGGNYFPNGNIIVWVIIFRMVVWNMRMVMLILRINHTIRNGNFGKQLKFGKFIPWELFWGTFSQTSRVLGLLTRVECMDCQVLKGFHVCDLQHVFIDRDRICMYVWSVCHCEFA